MRSRDIRPGFYKNEQLIECSSWARLIYPGLWMIADCLGILEDRPKRIKMELLPADDVNVDDLLNELASQKLIVRYEAEGAKYIFIPGFARNQNPHPKEKSKGYPLPENYQQGKNTANKENKLSIGLTPDSCSLTPDSHNPLPPEAESSECSEESKTEALEPQGKNTEAAADPQHTAAEKQHVNPLDEWFEKFWDHYPRHEDKKRAYKTFMALFHRQAYQKQRDRMNNLIVRLTRYIYDCNGKEQQYIKLPSTWLNAHSFDDEPEENEILRSEKWVSHANNDTD